MRHVRACNNAKLPGERLAFLIGGALVGYVTRAAASAMSGFAAVGREGDDVVLTDPAALPGIARAMADQGLCRWRGEAFDVRADHRGPVLAKIDRGALPLYGIGAVGVHVNGLVSGTHLWVARRAADKALDPGKLDHVVAGGVPAGLDPAATLVKEAAEEAAIPADLASRAVHVATLGYAMDRVEGLRRDTLQCYDLNIPAGFVPRPSDGEVEAFELWPLERVFEAVRDTDAFKFNVNLVLIDLFIRRGLIGGRAAAELGAALAR